MRRAEVSIFMASLLSLGLTGGIIPQITYEEEEELRKKRDEEKFGIKETLTPLQQESKIKRASLRRILKELKRTPKEKRDTERIIQIKEEMATLKEQI